MRERGRGGRGRRHRQTDRRTDGRTDGQIDRQTDRHIEIVLEKSEKERKADERGKEIGENRREEWKRGNIETGEKRKRGKWARER